MQRAAILSLKPTPVYLQHDNSLLLRAKHTIQRARKNNNLVAKSSGDGPSGEADGTQGDLDKAFAAELKRRAQAAQAAQTAAKDPFSSPSTSAPSSTAAKSPFTKAARPRAPPPPRVAMDGTQDQRQRSIDMVNEGLEGLPGRASQLLQLGGSVFLAFLPFMLAFSLVFTGIYAVFGESFLHTGEGYSRPPVYYDTDKLLSESTVDPYVPYDRR